MRDSPLFEFLSGTFEALRQLEIAYRWLRLVRSKRRRRAAVRAARRLSYPDQIKRLGVNYAAGPNGRDHAPVKYKWGAATVELLATPHNPGLPAGWEFRPTLWDTGRGWEHYMGLFHTSYCSPQIRWWFIQGASMPVYFDVWNAEVELVHQLVTGIPFREYQVEQDTISAPPGMSRTEMRRALS